MEKASTELGKWYHLIFPNNHSFLKLYFLYIYVHLQLPDKSIAALVRYYYSWKKTRARSSLMDRQVRRMVAHRTGDETASTNVDTAEPVVAAVPSDSDEDKQDNVLKSEIPIMIMSS